MKSANWIVLALGGFAFFPGCAIVSTGHVVALEKVDSFRPGETTKAEVLTALGAPESIVENTLDHTTVLSYQWITDRVIGIGLPPFFMAARKADKGFQLNVAFAADGYQGYTLTTLDQALFGRGAAAAAEAPAVKISRPPEKTTDEFHDPRPVDVEGWHDDIMEPFISRDGQWLFFNNRNTADVNTDLYYARRIDDLHFRFVGEVRGANSPVLDACASMDESGRFYMTTTREYARSFRTIYAGDFKDGAVSKLRAVEGNFTRSKSGWVAMDVEVTADGRSLYVSDAFFANGTSVPQISHLRLAVRDASGAFNVPPNEADILKSVTSVDDLEYAPDLSRDEREIFFTRLTPKPLRIRIMRAKRARADEPFGEPETISAITGLLVEAPTLAPDGRTLYYHKKDGPTHRLYRVVRDHP